MDTLTQNIEHVISEGGSDEAILNLIRSTPADITLIQKSFTVPISKVDEDKQQIFGWASVIVRDDGSIVVDHQDDAIDLETLEDAAYDFVANSRQPSEMHEKIGIGHLIESLVLTPDKREAFGLPREGKLGWWVGFQITDDLTWSKVKSGELAELSIRGESERVEYDEV